MNAGGSASFQLRGSRISIEFFSGKMIFLEKKGCIPAYCMI